MRDAHGNALGGVRTPQVDVPIATLTREGDGLNGFRFPFDTATLQALYPTHGAYLSAFVHDPYGPSPADSPPPKEPCK